MKTIRPDAPQLLSRCRALIFLLKESSSPEMKKQHAEEMERIIDMLGTSVNAEDVG